MLGFCSVGVTFGVRVRSRIYVGDAVWFVITLRVREKFRFKTRIKVRVRIRFGVELGLELGLE